MGKQLYFSSFGDPENVIKIRDKQLRKLGQSEIVVRMGMVPINQSDLIPVTGAYAHRTPLPNVLGYEGVGTVTEVHDEKDKYLIGKRVLPLRGEGTWQDFVITKTKFAIQVPDEIDNLIASQCYINPITAWIMCIEVLSLNKDSYLLINASNSSIGKSFIQLSKILNFKIISVIRKERYRAALEELGAYSVVNSTIENVRDVVMTITSGNGVDAAIDLIGGDSGTELAKCVQKDGIFRTIGLLSGEQVDWLLIKNCLPISAEIFHLRHWLENVSNEVWQQTFTSVFYRIKSGEWHLPEPAVIYPLSDYKYALREINHSARDGKIMIKFNEIN